MSQSDENLKTVTDQFIEDAKSLQPELPERKMETDSDEKLVKDLIENEKNEIPEQDTEQDTKSEDNIEFDDDKYPETEALTEAESEWEDILSSGVIMKKTLRKGIPDTRPQRANKCRIFFVCKLEDDTVLDQEEDYEIRLGECDVIQGLDVAIGLMDVNEKCIFKIEPRLAYGEKGLPPLIPENTTVIYEIELLSVEPEDIIETLNLQERKEIGNKKRERGNWWYQRGENNLAIQCYRRALDYLDEVEGGVTGPLAEGGEKTQVTDADLQALLEDRISVCNNMAAAQIKMELYDQALLSLQTVLRCQPDNVKALYRKAKVYMAKNDLVTALACLEKCKDLQPDDAIIHKELTTVNSLMQKQKNSEREYARRMFGGTQPNKTDASKQSPTKKKSSETNRHRVWATVCATFAVGLAGIAAYKMKYT